MLGGRLIARCIRRVPHGGREVDKPDWYCCTLQVEVGSLGEGEEAPLPILSCPTIDTHVTPLHLWDAW